MPLVEDKHMIQTLPPQRPHEPLGNAVCPRRSYGRADLSHAKTFNLPGEVAAIDAIAIPDQVSGRLWGAKIPSAIETINEIDPSRRCNLANRPQRVIENAGTGGSA